MGAIMYEPLSMLWVPQNPWATPVSDCLAAFVAACLMIRAGDAKRFGLVVAVASFAYAAYRYTSIGLVNLVTVQLPQMEWSAVMICIGLFQAQIAVVTFAQLANLSERTKTRFLGKFYDPKDSLWISAMAVALLLAAGIALLIGSEASAFYVLGAVQCLLLWRTLDDRQGLMDALVK